MARGSGSAGCYPPVKPHKPMECVHKRSGIGGELVAFPCITPMAVGSRCFRHPTNRLHIRLTKHANRAEGVQYAITSLSNGTAKSCRKRSTAHFPEDESIQQIASRALLGSPWFSLPLFRLPRRWRRGVGLVAFGEERVIATKEACKHQEIQFALA